MSKKGPSRSLSEKEAVLVLEDGTVFRGLGFGAAGKSYGEVVFNTGMVGYTEALTDPSYKGQILVQTYPLVGNYGVCSTHFESEGPKVEGYVIHELCRNPNHWASELTLDEWLEEAGVPGIEGVDTRMLTKKIRVHGTMLGILCVHECGDEPSLELLRDEARSVPDPNWRDLVSEVSTNRVKRFDVGGKDDIVLIDFGVKMSIVKGLMGRGLNVVLVPPNTTTDKILDMNPRGVVLSNGPGDPKMCKDTIKVTQELLESRVPLLGICLGNQILALACAADTYKLKFGHRGQNHPCIDLSTGRCYITSQNHGFVVDSHSAERAGLQINFINANDKTVEGIVHKTLPAFGVQFHPEASPGPNDTNFLFERFERLVKRTGRGLNA